MTRVDGGPRLYAFDHERNQKRCMSGPKAVWNIAHGAAPRPGWLVYRRCVNKLCLNPVHLAQARDKAEMCLHIVRSGKRKGTAMESRRRNAEKGRRAMGIVEAPIHIKEKCLAAPRDVSCTELAACYGLSRTQVSRWRCDARRQEQQEQAE